MAIIWLFAAQQAFAAVGGIGGQFSATQEGQAAYTMPLPTPGGAGGLTPHLGIVYASGSGPGLLGWNITLGGVSVINRCPPSITYDKKAAPLTFTATDRFCLDGNELTTGEYYGVNGTKYVITPTAHLLAISHTTHTVNGPNWFEVKHPDGSIWEYGHQYSSRVDGVNAAGTIVHRLWALDKITDASGNTITFHYTQPSGTNSYYIHEIDWGGNPNAGTSADHAYVFNYATVSAGATRYRYLVGNKITRNRRLSKITLEYDGSAVLTWTPTYLADGSGSGRSRLSNLTECAGSDCLPPTVFDWQQGTSGYATPENSGQPGPSDADSFVADINGDGLEDLIYARANVWRVRFGLASGGFGSEHSTGVASTQHPDWAQPIHYRPGAA
ncbi:MAG: SpvB/TcaC N-terminal domain-containing protein, partial [Gammaproteobacteria bacterium]